MDTISRNYRKIIYARYTQDHNPDFMVFDKTRYENSAATLLSRIRPWLPESKDAACLDVACGTGILLYIFQSTGYRHITGVDISPQQINAARQVCEDVHLMDALEYLKAHPGEFDFITAFNILEHYEKDELLNIVEALYQALRPGGRLVVEMPNAESPWGLSVRYGDLTHELALNANSLNHLLELVGFTEFSARECTAYIHGIKSLIRWVIWRFIHLGLLIWNYAETGSAGSGIYTRVFMAKADKPHPSSRK